MLFCSEAECETKERGERKKRYGNKEELTNIGFFFLCSNIITFVLSLCAGRHCFWGFSFKITSWVVVVAAAGASVWKCPAGCRSRG